MRYAVESQRQAMTATGVVNPVMAWEITPEGSRRPSKDTQEHDPDTGMPLWNVEVTYRTESWGEQSTVTAMVRVGAAERPAPAEYSRITFKVLVVEVRKTKAGGVGEYWSAEAVDHFTPMAGSGSGGSKPAAAAKNAA